MAVDVYAVMLRTFRARPDVIDEFLKVFESKFDTTPAVVFPRLRPRISAARLCRIVGHIFTVSRGTMNDIPHAATTFCAPASKQRSRARLGFFAIALAEPQVVAPFNYDQHPKPLPGQINELLLFIRAGKTTARPG